MIGPLTWWHKKHSPTRTRESGVSGDSKALVVVVVVIEYNMSEGYGDEPGMKSSFEHRAGRVIEYNRQKHHPTRGFLLKTKDRFWRQAGQVRHRLQYRRLILDA